MYQKPDFVGVKLDVSENFATYGEKCEPWYYYDTNSNYIINTPGCSDQEWTGGTLVPSQPMNSNPINCYFTLNP